MSQFEMYEQAKGRLQAQYEAAFADIFRIVGPTGLVAALLETLAAWYDVEIERLSAEHEDQ